MNLPKRTIGYTFRVLQLETGLDVRSATSCIACLRDGVELLGTSIERVLALSASPRSQPRVLANLIFVNHSERSSSAFRFPWPSKKAAFRRRSVPAERMRLAQARAS